MLSVDLLAHFVLIRGQVAPRPTNHEFLEFRLQTREVVGKVRWHDLASVGVVIERGRDVRRTAVRGRGTQEEPLGNLTFQYGEQHVVGLVVRVAKALGFVDDHEVEVRLGAHGL